MLICHHLAVDLEIETQIRYAFAALRFVEKRFPFLDLKSS